MPEDTTSPFASVAARREVVEGLKMIDAQLGDGPIQQILVDAIDVIRHLEKENAELKSSRAALRHELQARDQEQP